VSLKVIVNTLWSDIGNRIFFFVFCFLAFSLVLSVCTSKLKDEG
jgi:hypothetical protein